ncbi:MAG: CBS domain-containing protein [Candidatus Nanopelagicales bacterium]
MKIASILASKGDYVATIAPNATVSELLALLAEKGIGAVVVSSDGVLINGIASERDVARSLASIGATALDAPVSQIMTKVTTTCEMDSPVEEIMVAMTQNRVRHVPVLEDGKMVGIVSIGDIVKARIDHLEDERKSLLSYITS